MECLLVQFKRCMDVNNPVDQDFPHALGDVLVRLMPVLFLHLINWVPINGAYARGFISCTGLEDLSIYFMVFWWAPWVWRWGCIWGWGNDACHGWFFLAFLRRCWCWWCPFRILSFRVSWFSVAFDEMKLDDSQRTLTN